MIARYQFLIAGIIVILGTNRLDAMVRYVATDGVASGVCDSWVNACTLEYGLGVATEGDEVWVKSGTYQSPSATSPFSIPNAVKVIGGFAGSETAASQSDPAANSTIIDGDGHRAVLSEETSSSTMLRGFTIRNGHDDGYENGQLVVRGGGGLLLEDSSALVVQCIFEWNTSSWWGAAVHIRGLGTPKFINCTFRNNGDSATIAGAGASLDGSGVEFVNCLFANNQANEGGAIAMLSGSMTLANCTLTKNDANVGSGGAIHDEEGGATIHNSIIWDNSAARSHANIYNDAVSETSISKSDVEGGWSGAGNIDSDPLFTNPTHGDFTLLSNSPCQNAGSNGDLPNDDADLDWDGLTSQEKIPRDLKVETRKVLFVVDMGCYEIPIGGGGS